MFIKVIRWFKEGYKNWNLYFPAPTRQSNGSHFDSHKFLSRLFNSTYERVVAVAVVAVVAVDLRWKIKLTWLIYRGLDISLTMRLCFYNLVFYILFCYMDIRVIFKVLPTYHQKYNQPKIEPCYFLSPPLYIIQLDSGILVRTLSG